MIMPRPEAHDDVRPSGRAIRRGARDAGSRRHSDTDPSPTARRTRSTSRSACTDTRTARLPTRRSRFPTGPRPTRARPGRPTGPRSGRRGTSSRGARSRRPRRITQRRRRRRRGACVQSRNRDEHQDPKSRRVLTHFREVPLACSETGVAISLAPSTAKERLERMRGSPPREVGASDPAEAVPPVTLSIPLRTQLWAGLGPSRGVYRPT